MIWWVVNSLATTLVLAAIVWGVCLSRRIGPAIKHVLWLVVLAKMILPPVFDCSVPTPTAWQQPLSRFLASETVSPAHPSQRAFDDSSKPLSTGTRQSVARRAETQDPSAVRPVTAATESTTLWGLLWSLLRAAWVCGSIVAVALQIRRMAALSRLLADGRKAPVRLTETVANMARGLGIDPPAIRLVAGHGSPFVFSLAGTYLIWPAATLGSMDRVKLRGVIAHELAHLRRRDHWVGWLEVAVACVWWWNPLFWYVRRQVRRNADLACDEWVVASLPDHRHAYAEALIDSSAVCSPAPSPLALAFGAGSRETLERRITMIMLDDVKCRTSLHGFPLVAMLAIVAVPGFSLAQQQAVGPDAGGALAVFEPGPASGVWEPGGEDDYWEVTVDDRRSLDADVETLVITTAAGDIELLRSSNSRLTIEGAVRAKKKHVDQDEVSDDFSDHVTVSSSGGTLTIEDAHMQESGNNPWKVSLKIMVPRALSVTATSGAGDVIVTYASGAVALTSSAGDVKLDQAEENFTNVTVTSGAGDVQVTGGRIDGDVKATSGAGEVKLSVVGSITGDHVRLSSGAGDVVLTFGGDVSGQFDITAGVGSITIDPSLDIEVERHMVSASASGSVGRGGPHYVLSSGAGSIKIRTR